MGVPKKVSLEEFQSQFQVLKEQLRAIGVESVELEMIDDGRPAFKSMTIAGAQYSDTLDSADLTDRPFPSPVPAAVRESLEQFKADHPENTKTAFVMMRFGATSAHAAIVSAVRQALSPLGIEALRADDKQYHDDLFQNVLTYVYGCSFGVAVLERIEAEEFNPNVALEIGYMLALKKPVCLLKDKTLQTLPSDLMGRLYKVFDPLDAGGSIPDELRKWIQDKGLA